MDSTPLAQGLLDLIGPLFFVLLALLAIRELFKGRFGQLFKLIGASIVVIILLYRPDVLRAMSELIATLLPGASAGTPPAG
jgi:hypothetical protein